MADTPTNNSKVPVWEQARRDSDLTLELPGGVEMFFRTIPAGCPALTGLLERGTLRGASAFQPAVGIREMGINLGGGAAPPYRQSTNGVGRCCVAAQISIPGLTPPPARWSVLLP